MCHRKTLSLSVTIGHSEGAIIVHHHHNLCSWVVESNIICLYSWKLVGLQFNLFKSPTIDSKMHIHISTFTSRRNRSNRKLYWHSRAQWWYSRGTVERSTVPASTPLYCTPTTLYCINTGAVESSAGLDSIKYSMNCRNSIDCDSVTPWLSQVNKWREPI